MRIGLGEQPTVTDVIVTDAVTVTDVEPDLPVSCVDVAVTVRLGAVLGAVRSPEELIVPALALQLTVEL